MGTSINSGSGWSKALSSAQHPAEESDTRARTCLTVKVNHVRTMCISHFPCEKHGVRVDVCIPLVHIYLHALSCHSVVGFASTIYQQYQWSLWCYKIYQSIPSPLLFVCCVQTGWFLMTWQPGSSLHKINYRCTFAIRCLAPSCFEMLRSIRLIKTYPKHRAKSCKIQSLKNRGAKLQVVNNVSDSVCTRKPLKLLIFIWNMFTSWSLIQNNSKYQKIAM